MIILFTQSEHEWSNWNRTIGFLIYNLDCKCIILHDFNKKLFNKASVIIPFGVGSQKYLCKFGKYKNKMMLCDENVYNILDDKIRFYNFIKKENILQNGDIKLINTYDKYYNGPNKYNKFIIKHRNGIGSSCNKIKKDNIYNLLNKYSNKYQIQDLIEIDRINSVNVLCHNGEIVSGFNFITPHFIENNYYSKNGKQILDTIDDHYMEIINKIAKKLNLNGFMEFEFITDKNGNNYLMECNPRISGNLNCALPNNECPFIRNLIVPYFEILRGKKFELRKYKRNLDIIYYGVITMPKYEMCECGQIHLEHKNIIY